MRVYTKGVDIPIGAYANYACAGNDNIYVLDDSGIQVIHDNALINTFSTSNDLTALTYCGQLVLGGTNKVYTDFGSVNVDGQVINLATDDIRPNTVWGVTDTGKLFELDLSTSGVLYVNLNDIMPWKVKVHQGVVYVTNINDAIYVYDGTLRTLSVANAESVDFYKDNLVVACMDDADVRIIDQSGNVLRSVSIGENNSARAQSVKVVGDYAYVADYSDFRFVAVDLKDYSTEAYNVRSAPLNLFADEIRHRIITVGQGDPVGYVCQYTYADSIDPVLSIKVKPPSVDATFSVSVKNKGGGGDDPDITYDIGGDLNNPFFVSPIMAFQYKGTLTGAVKKLSAISGQYPIADPFTKTIKLVANPYTPHNTKTPETLYGYSKGQKAGDISKVKITGHLNAKTSTSVLKTVLWSGTLDKSDVQNLPHNLATPLYVLYITPLMCTGLDDIRKYIINFNSAQVHMISDADWNALTDFENNNVPFHKIYVIYAKDGPYDTFRAAYFSSADYQKQVLAGTWEVFKFTTNTYTPAYTTSTNGTDPPFEMESDDPANEETANRLARLTFLTRAPKRTLRCEVLDGWPKVGEGVEVDGEVYVITSVSYSGGVFSVTGEYIHGGASGASNVRTLSASILNKSPKPKIGQVTGFQEEGFINVEYEGHSFRKLRQQGADNDHGWIGVEKPNPIFKNPYEE